MNAADVIAYGADGALVCCDCAAENIPAEFHGCGEPGRLFDPGWHDCGENGPDGSPCHIEAKEGEVWPIFGDNVEDIVGQCCHDCGEVFE